MTSVSSSSDSWVEGRDRFGESTARAVSRAMVDSPSNGSLPVASRKSTAAEAEEVAALIDPFAAELFGGHVGGGADDGAGLRQVRLIGDGAGQAEVEDFYLGPLPSSQTLAGLMSRWIIVFSWAAANPSAISRPMRTTSGKGSVFSRLSILSSDSP